MGGSRYQLDILDAKLAPGSASADGRTYLLGTDEQGRDMLSAILYGLRISLGVGVISTVLALALSGLVEGFVTRQPWPWPVKIGIGTLALAVFLAYMLWLGRRAAATGETGDLTEYEAGTQRLVAG